MGIINIATYEGVITMDIFTSFISGPIFIGIVLIYSFCVTVYFILKKNKTSLNNVEGTFTIKVPASLIFTSIIICIIALSTIFISKNFISSIYFLLPVIFLLLLIRKSSKLILRKENLEAAKLKCYYKSINHINLKPNSNPEKYNLNITIKNKTFTIIIKANDKDKIKEILDSKPIINRLK